jgi:hypothetical protein
MSLSTIRFTRAALVDAGWDLAECELEVTGVSATHAADFADGAYVFIRLNEIGSDLEMSFDTECGAADQILSFMKATNTQYTVH